MEYHNHDKIKYHVYNILVVNNAPSIIISNILIHFEWYCNCYDYLLKINYNKIQRNFSQNNISNLWTLDVCYFSIIIIKESAYILVKIVIFIDIEPNYLNWSARLCKRNVQLFEFVATLFVFVFVLVMVVWYLLQLHVSVFVMRI